jgi:parallel beta-helix repeat protein
MNPWVAFENQTIYIRADGSVDPTGAPILRRGDLYTIVYSMVSGSDGIIIERHSIIIDGNGSAILGLPGARSVGIRLSDNNDVTIKNLEITGFDYGVQLGDCYNCTLESCNIAESHEYGVLVIDPLSVFANNTLHDCNITGAIHLAGVVLASSSILFHRTTSWMTVVESGSLIHRATRLLKTT